MFPVRRIGVCSVFEKEADEPSGPALNGIPSMYVNLQTLTGEVMGVTDIEYGPS